MDPITNIDDFIKINKQNVYRVDNYYDKLLVSPNPEKHIFKIAIQDFFLEHKKEFKILETQEMVNELFFYKPKMFSQSYYGTTEMWLPLLRVNNMRNITEFNKTLIKVYNKTVVKDLIDIFFKREGKL